MRAARSKGACDSSFSSSDSFSDGTFHPFFPSHEFESEPVIVDLKIAVAASRNSTGIDLLHLLRHNADIEGVIAALVAETIELQAVVEPHQRNDVFLELHVGAPSASTPASAAAAAAATNATAAAPAAAATNATTAAALLERGTATAALGPRKVVCAAIAKARLSTFGEVLGFLAVAWIEAVTSRSSFCFCLTKIRLLAFQRRLLP